MANRGYFTGSGATGVSIEDNATIEDLCDLYSANDISDPAERERALRGWRNPGQSDGYAQMNEFANRPAERRTQADILVNHRCARASALDDLIPNLPSEVWANTTIRDLVIAGPSRRRRSVMVDAAARYNLEAALLGAIILAEQRDQSEAEDAADYWSAVMAGHRSSIGLGQTNIGTARTLMLLRDIFDDAMWSPWRFPPTMFVRMLADDTINILVTAKYLRMLADQGAEVEATRSNRMHDLLPTCARHGPGQYVRGTMQDLSILARHSSGWTDVPDPSLPEEPPTGVTNITDGSPFALNRAQWDSLFRGHYYVRLIGTEYTSCPFDPHDLDVGITLFMEEPLEPGRWLFDDDLLRSAQHINWGIWVAIAFEDMRLELGG